jgi:pimeloyl-ACP methyl ester carboxylesterase
LLQNKPAVKFFFITLFVLIAFDCKPPGTASGKNKMVDTSSAQLTQKTGKVTVNGHVFNYIEAGSGPTLILIHGSIGDYREWSKQMTPLSQHYHIIAYSRRYHWPNPAPGSDADAGLDQQVNDLLDFIKFIGIGPVRIVGHSFGGAIALSFTLQHPELVQGLVLAEPAVSGVLGKTPANDSSLKESQAIRATMKDVFATGNIELIAKTYADHVAPGDFERANPEERKMLFDNVSALQLDFNSQRPPFTCEDAQTITVPVLVLAGNQSPMGLQRIAETTAQCIRGARFVRIPQATHWLQHDQPQLFNDEVLAFLAAIKK